MEFMKRFPSVKEKVPFENFGFKGGILFKISLNFSTDRICLNHNRNTFPNARLNNSIVDGLQSEALNSLDATYVFVRQN
jgi:hypothetical protein